MKRYTVEVRTPDGIFEICEGGFAYGDSKEEILNDTVQQLTEMTNMILVDDRHGKPDVVEVNIDLEQASKKIGDFIICGYSNIIITEVPA